MFPWQEGSGKGPERGDASIEAGSMDAQVELGKCHLRGQGVRK